jgi:hypothetical protein
VKKSSQFWLADFSCFVLIAIATNALISSAATRHAMMISKPAMGSN